MIVEKVEGTGITFYHFSTGERARVKYNRYTRSIRTRHWMDCYTVTVIRENKSSVTVIVDGYEEERHRVDMKDLVPEDYPTGTLA